MLNVVEQCKVKLVDGRVIEGEIHSSDTIEYVKNNYSGIGIRVNGKLTMIPSKDIVVCISWLPTEEYIRFLTKFSIIEDFSNTKDITLQLRDGSVIDVENAFKDQVILGWRMVFIRTEEEKVISITVPVGEKDDVTIASQKAMIEMFDNGDFRKVVDSINKNKETKDVVDYILTNKGFTDSIFDSLLLYSTNKNFNRFKEIAISKNVDMEEVKEIFHRHYNNDKTAMKDLKALLA